MFTFSQDLDLAPRSVILTTLFARHYSGEESTFQAVDNILSGILRSLPAVGRLSVINPMNPKEDSARVGPTKPTYLAFLSFLRRFSDIWQLLSDATGIQNVAATLKKLFGKTSLRWSSRTR